MFVNRRQAQIFMHCIGWLVFLVLPVIFISGQNEDVPLSALISSPFYWLFLVSYAVLFYSHTYFAFPKWYLQKKFCLYAAYLLVFFLFIFFLKPFDHLVGVGRHHEEGVRPPPREVFERMPDHPRGRRPIPGGGMPQFDIVSITLFILTVAMSIAVVTSKQLRSTKERALKAETKKVEAELSFLKTQIHPHFLFNTLNNIYSLAIANNERTAEAILKLSNILRYVIEDVSQTFVPLTNEISCIEDYISLQKLRLGSKTTVHFNMQGDPSGTTIAPMLLMPFIENAFKYGVSAHQPATISISIDVTGATTKFFCSNGIFSTSPPSGTGIGLVNTRQRLDHLYNGNYKLEIDNTGSIFTVKLNIEHQNKSS